MRTTNLNAPGEFSHSVVRGHTSTHRAGSSGITVSDSAIEVNNVIEERFVGGTVTDLDDGIVLISVGGGVGPGGGDIDVGTVGSTTTFDVSSSWLTYVRATLTADLTVTLTGATAGELSVLVVGLEQDGTGGWDVTWPGSVVWVDGTTPTPDTTAGSITFYELWTDDGGLTWFGTVGGGGSSVGALDDLSDVTITSAASGDRLRFDGSTWSNSSMVWEPMIASDGTVMTDGLLNPSMHEVAY